jgi:CTP synthase
VRFIFVVGGVLSGLGKGIVTASVGRLLKSEGFNVTAIKIDPYINVDAGTLRPTEHGEVWVTEDGGEIDQDLGTFERFLDINIPKKNNITTGQIYSSVIGKERGLHYGGKDVEPIPDIVNEIKERIVDASKGFDFALVEVGGTTGDIENLLFLYAIRELGREYPSLYVMVTYLPLLKNTGELKTKPTQHAVQRLRETGIFPDIIVTRSEIGLDKPRIETISKRCFVDEKHIIDDPDVSNIYSVPLLFKKQGLDKIILSKFGLKPKKEDLVEWKSFVDKMDNAKKNVKIAIVGKYVSHGYAVHRDVYVSVIEAVRHAAASLSLKPIIEQIQSSEITEDNVENVLGEYDGIIVPGGFGASGVEGKITAAKYAREKKVPYLGLCYGMQLAIVEFARNVCGMKGAHTTEIDKDTDYPVIDFMPEQKELVKNKKYGATMRLGSYAATLKRGTKLYAAYKSSERWLIDKKEAEKLTNNTTQGFRLGNLEKFDDVVLERHRHRYEVNPKFIKELENKGMIFSGFHVRKDGQMLMEFMELPDHPCFIGTQGHPEFKSRPNLPSPMYVMFLEAAAERR